MKYKKFQNLKQNKHNLVFLVITNRYFKLIKLKENILNIFVIK